LSAHSGTLSALWSALAAHAPERLSRIRNDIQDEGLTEQEYEENFNKLKQMALMGGAVI
jgi:hypothetical protein